MNKFKITPGTDTLTVDLEGKFDKESADEFIEEFNSILKTVNPKNCELIFNAGRMNVVSPDLHESLKNCFKMYQKIGFKKISVFLENNVILGMQVKRLANDAGLSNYEIIYE